MLVIHRRIDTQPRWDAELHLTFDARSKSRLRCFSAEGEDVGLFLNEANRRCTTANACKLKMGASYAFAPAPNNCCMSPAPTPSN